MDSDIERQKKLEADAVRDGLLRYAKSYEYHMARTCAGFRVSADSRFKFDSAGAECFGL